MTKAIYAFSGDPITYGHIDVVERASKAFDKVIVGIGVNPKKDYMFSLEERTRLANKSLAHIKNAEITPFQGLLVDYAYEQNIPFVVKGIRNAADADYEQNLDQHNKAHNLGIDTLTFYARPELAHISSSAVKKIQKEQGLIDRYVPLCVKQALEERISGQYILGLTGEIGAGKSYIGKEFEKLAKERNIPLHNIELDHIGHQILGELKEPRYQEVRKTIIENFGNNIKNSDGTINRKALGEIVFTNPNELTKLNDIMYTPLMVRLRRELYGKNGLILFNAALLAESDMAYLSNNNVLLVNANQQSQERRLKERDLNPNQIKTRLASQYDFNQKKKKLEDKTQRDNQGKVWVVNNSDDSDPKNITNAFNEITEELLIDRTLLDAK